LFHGVIVPAKGADPSFSKLIEDVSRWVGATVPSRGQVQPGGPGIACHPAERVGGAMGRRPDSLLRRSGPS